MDAHGVANLCLISLFQNSCKMMNSVFCRIHNKTKSKNNHKQQPSYKNVEKLQLCHKYENDFWYKLKLNVSFTVSQNCRKFGLLYPILKRTFKYGRDMPVFQDFKVPRRDRNLRSSRPKLRKIVSRDTTVLDT